MSVCTIVCPECSHINSITCDDTAPLCTACKSELDDAFPVDVNDAACMTHISNNSIPVIVDFYSTVCGPCMAMYDDYEDAALGFPLKVRFLKIDADVHQEVARKYRVGALPTLIAFHDGEEVNRVSAQLSRVELSLWAEGLCDL